MTENKLVINILTITIYIALCKQKNKSNCAYLYTRVPKDLQKTEKNIPCVT
jgi:hypothetical protein